uniref:Uncharacterized protein n=1 Tax=Magallana gigas TaxID=29159 RepID=K1PLQ6_MAGGI|eukprot:XP_011431454.1 PREDICTED: uncharacterized protein LOC105331105 [Crassostrea gigas]
MSLFSDGVVHQDISRTSNCSFENRISRWTCMLEKQPDGDSEFIGICSNQQCRPETNLKTKVNIKQDKALCAKLPIQSDDPRQSICKYCPEVLKETSKSRFYSSVNGHNTDVDLVSKLNSQWVNRVKIPIELRGSVTSGNEIQGFIGLLQKQIKGIESFSPVLSKSEHSLEQKDEEIRRKLQERKEIERRKATKALKSSRDLELQRGLTKRQRKRQLVNEDSEIAVGQQGRVSLEVNHTITESHQLLHVKTIIGLLHSIIDVILFAMSGSLVFDLNDAEIWKGFAIRCKELESQLGILTSNFLEKKIAEKLSRKQKREDNVLDLIASFEERPTKSKVRKLRKATEILVENERQLGLIQGEIIFIKDITLISESLRDLFNFMDAELSRCEKGSKSTRVKSGRIKRSREVRDESASDENQAAGRKRPEQAGPSSKGVKAGETQEKPQGDDPSPSKSKDEKAKDEKTKDEKAKEEKAKDEKPKDEKSKGGPSTSGKSPEKGDIKDQMVQAIQGKVGEIGEQLGGQVKQMGDRVFQGLFQKAKDLTNLNINNGTSAMDDVDDLYYESNSLSSTDDDSDSELSCSGDSSEKTNNVRGTNMLNLMHTMRRLFKRKGKRKGELPAGGKPEECLEFSPQITNEIMINEDSSSDDDDISDITTNSEESEERAGTSKWRQKQQTKMPISETETEKSDDISSANNVDLSKHSRKRNQSPKYNSKKHKVKSRVSSVSESYSDSETNAEVSKIDDATLHPRVKQTTRSPKSKWQAVTRDHRRAFSPSNDRRKQTTRSPKSKWQAVTRDHRRAFFPSNDRRNDYQSSQQRGQSIHVGGPRLSFNMGDVGVKFSPDGKYIGKEQGSSKQNKTEQPFSKESSPPDQQVNTAGSGMFPRLKQLSFYEKPEIQNTMTFVEDGSASSSSVEEVILSPSKDAVEFVTSSLSDSSIYTKPVFEEIRETEKEDKAEKTEETEENEAPVIAVEDPLPTRVGRVAKKAAMYTCTMISLGLGSWSIHQSYKCYSECRLDCFDMSGFDKLLELRHL